jgi:hypothetical protein
VFNQINNLQNEINILKLYYFLVAWLIAFLFLVGLAALQTLAFDRQGAEETIYHFARKEMFAIYKIGTYTKSNQ